MKFLGLDKEQKESKLWELSIKELRFKTWSILVALNKIEEWIVNSKILTHSPLWLFTCLIQKYLSLSCFAIAERHLYSGKWLKYCFFWVICRTVSIPIYDFERYERDGVPIRSQLISFCWLPLWYSVDKIDR